ncbi:hypothetical protein N0V88_000699 [Collariella sp. IMI 366227]|nr:hypothetical protein N0V88_000699 [Collariella sp. IMI 366227]
MLRKWKRYCEFAESEAHWKEVLENADRAEAMDFLEYLCQSCRITSWGTSWEYFRQYKQLYASVNGRYMDRNDSREVQKWHDIVLIDLYGLQPPNVRRKGVADANGLLVLLTFNIKYDTGIFSSERHRVQLAGCYLGLAFTGARPAEFIDGEKKKRQDDCLQELFPGVSRRSNNENDDKDDNKAPNEGSRLLDELLSQETVSCRRLKALYNEDILLMVVRHLETGEDVLAISIKFIYHKGADNKPKLTIFFFTPTRRLVFCFISVIVSLALHDGAFQASNLTSAKDVFQIKNRGPVKYTPLYWREEWLKRPVFRRLDGPALANIPDKPRNRTSPSRSLKTLRGTESDNSTSGDEQYRPLPYYKLKDDMARQSLDAGEENPVQPKDFRRGAANAANGNASDAVRDQMMRHDPKWATFNNAYINEKVGFHVQNAFLKEPTEDSLLRMLLHIGHMRDPRARKDMVPDEVWEMMPPDPEIEALEAERERLKGGRYCIKGTENEDRIRELGNLIASKKAQRNKNFEQAYRADYFYNRPTRDIERQANEDDKEEEYVEPTIDLQIPERAQLAEILCSQPDDLSAFNLVEILRPIILNF